MKFKGLHKLFFYSLPTHPKFFNELSQQVITTESANGTKRLKLEKSIMVLFEQFDALPLSRIISKDIAIELTKTKRAIYKFIL